jgi:hypothetical protein
MSDVLKARITNETVTINIGKLELRGMERVSEWEGMIKFDGPIGELILSQDEPDKSLFDSIFSFKTKNERGPTDRSFTVVKASETIVNALRPKPAPKAPECAPTAETPSPPPP